MSAWTVIPCLLTLRSEFNALAPGRDKGADGTIGDTAHTSSSDHTPDEDSRVLRDHDGDSKNEVHALDIDSTGPWPGTGTQKQRFHRLVMRIIAGERRKWLSATDRCRLNYLIWDGYIYDKDNDFEPVRYYGSDPHTSHAHASGRYETACENDTRPWGVLTPPPVEEDMAITDEDADKIARAILNKRIGRSTETVGMDLEDDDAPAIASLGERLAAVEGKLDEALALLRPETEPEDPPA
jgi:hypothetical protein